MTRLVCLKQNVLQLVFVLCFALQSRWSTSAKMIRRSDSGNEDDKSNINVRRDDLKSTNDLYNYSIKKWKRRDMLQGEKDSSVKRGSSERRKLKIKSYKHLQQRQKGRSIDLTRARDRSLRSSWSRKGWRGSNDRGSSRWSRRSRSRSRSYHSRSRSYRSHDWGGGRPHYRPPPRHPPLERLHIHLSPPDHHWGDGPPPPYYDGHYLQNPNLKRMQLPYPHLGPHGYHPYRRRGHYPYWRQ